MNVRLLSDTMLQEYFVEIQEEMRRRGLEAENEEYEFGHDIKHKEE